MRESTSKKEEELRNETVALITHEMRTALTSSGWTIESILKDYEDKIKDSDKKILSDLVKSNQTTVMHTVNLLDVSLSDIGKLAISLEWKKLSDVHDMLNEVLEKYSIGTKREGINLISNISLEDNREIEVDMLRLRIIIENLLENSIQYTKQDKKEIRLEVKNTKDNLNITISDTGIGIPDDEKDKVFSEFYRASNARKILNSGSGIGLSMTEKYVKAHHGSIRLESKLGVGTTFNISIPLKTVADVNEFLKQV
jgi:signal transduction histidine kinase